MPGDWVNISEDGTVYVNDIAIDEPYLKERGFPEIAILSRRIRFLNQKYLLWEITGVYHSIQETQQSGVFQRSRWLEKLNLKYGPADEIGAVNTN